MSGWPMPRLITSRPWAARAWARARTAKAFSSPMREKAGTTCSISALRAVRSQCLDRSESFIAPNDIATAIAPRITKVFTEA